MGLPSNLLLTVVIIGVSHVIWQLYFSPLRRFPGPFFAKFTNIWRFLNVAAGRPELTQKVLHRQYGYAVRTGPNCISLSDPSLIKSIYNIKGNFLKSNFYTVNDVVVDGHRISNVFGTQSNDFHSAQIKPIQKYYTMSGVLACEPLVDRTTQRFLHILDTRFEKTKASCKLEDWLLYYAWDNIGEITYGEPLGFLDQGSDVKGILNGARSSVDYFAVIGQIPWLDYLLDKSPIRRIGPASFGAIVEISVERLINRHKTGERAKDAQKDYLDYFIEKIGSADWINDQQVVGWLMINMMAGADTTAIALCATVYFVLKQPRICRRLKQELVDAKLSLPISYKTAQSLPYLDAVISESLRMHPAVGLPLERVVPPEGLRLPDGRTIPGGTIVGMNPWVVHADTNVFGEDAESFRPERWLPYDGEVDYAARKRSMKETDLTFGAGNRVCLGKNVSLMEIYKIIATLFLQYDMELVDPKKQWHVQNSWFVRQSGIEVNMKRSLSAL